MRQEINFRKMHNKSKNDYAFGSDGGSPKKVDTLF